MVYPNGGGVEMERGGEKAKTEESARGGAGSLGWSGPQRGEETRQQTERTQGWAGQKPQEDHCGAAQCAPATAWPSQESLNLLIVRIRARFGDYVIGLGDGGIRYSIPTLSHR